MRFTKKIFLALAASALAACGGNEMYNSDIFCYFTYNTSIHNTGLLGAVL